MKKDPEDLNAEIKVRLNGAEKDMLFEKAEDLGLNLSDLMRKIIKEYLKLK